MLKDYELDYKSDESQNDGEVMLKGTPTKLNLHLISATNFFLNAQRLQIWLW